MSSTYRLSPLCLCNDSVERDRNTSQAPIRQRAASSASNREQVKINFLAEITTIYAAGTSCAGQYRLLFAFCLVYASTSVLINGSSTPCPCYIEWFRHVLVSSFDRTRGTTRVVYGSEVA